MFRRVLPGREAEAVEFLSREPEVNHFILGDIECFGLGDPNVALWLEGMAEPRAALLKYYGSFILYAPGGADARHAARIMREHGFGMLSGRPEYVHPVIEELGTTPNLHANVLMRLSPGRLRPVEREVETVRVTLGNLDSYVDGIVELRHNIPEFSMGINVDALRDELKIGCKRIFIAKDGGRTVAMAMTTVERGRAAMIVSVCTLAEYRGRGYASSIMTALCRSLDAEGKTAILFYNNPAAGRIYSALGFEDIGRWCFASFN
jgi:predicted GNAT family acetyltransferase